MLLNVRKRRLQLNDPASNALNLNLVQLYATCDQKEQFVASPKCLLRPVKTLTQARRHLCSYRVLMHGDANI